LDVVVVDDDDDNDDVVVVVVVVVPVVAVVVVDDDDTNTSRFLVNDGRLKLLLFAPEPEPKSPPIPPLDDSKKMFDFVELLRIGVLVLVVDATAAADVSDDDRLKGLNADCCG
jgi:hypothetical protein